MKRELSQKLLSVTLEWDSEQIEEYIRRIEDFSDMKYDMYQQFKPGSRFTENMSIWLNQFEKIEERRIALNFILNNLVFISPNEMNHLINTVYPDIILPIIKRDTISIIENDKNFKREDYKAITELLVRQSFFFGLSDGAHTDIFRRSNPNLSNEQICISYEIPDTKLENMLNEMGVDSSALCKRHSLNNVKCDIVKYIFLLDDFSGSGISYLRREDGDEWKGKIHKVIDILQKSTGKSYINLQSVKFYLILYLATPMAKQQIEEQIKLLYASTSIQIEIIAVQMISPIELSKEESELFEHYYDSSIEDRHYKKGKCVKPYLGFNECSLPLVIYHNTPNNSFPILWSGDRALFPRVTRHKEVT